MDQVYKCIYSGAAGSPPCKNARPAIIVPQGHKVCVQVNLMSQGYITRLVVKQSDGTGASATINLYDSKTPFPPGYYVGADQPADDPELYQVLPPQTAISGGKLDLTSEEPGFPFMNQDGGYANSQRYLYLVIDPSEEAVDETTWDVAITVHRNMG